jgi:eukaryotic translation initiation factor 2C
MRIENENAVVEQLERKQSIQKKTPLEPRMPQRPGFGTQGKAVLLWANYFHLTDYGELVLYRYSIEVSGYQGSRVPTGKKLKRVIQLLIEDHLAQYSGEIVTDFKSNLLCKTEIELEEEYIVTYRSEDEDDAQPNAKSYQVRLQPTGMITVSELMDYLTSTQASQLFGSKEEIIQALNIAVGHYPKAARHIASIGANKHYNMNAATSEGFDLGAGLMAIRGFFVSVRTATARILVNVQVKHGAFYNDGPLEALMHAFLSQNGPNNVKLGNFLKKLSVDVTHITRQNRSGQRIARIKAIMGLATPGDGRGQEHPPIVPTIGAGSKDVKFFIDGAAPKTPKKKGKGKQKAGSSATAGPSTSGGYISVYDYFKQSKYHYRTS